MNVLSTEIFDNMYPQQDQATGEEYFQPSEISVLVEFEHNGESYRLDFQTTSTGDYGAYSSNLKPYDGSDDYDSLYAAINDDENFNELLQKVKHESGAQELRKNYIEENYNADSGDFWGMDANSKINRATKKG